jgi:hypothetical protein
LPSAFFASKRKPDISKIGSQSQPDLHASSIAKRKIFKFNPEQPIEKLDEAVEAQKYRNSQRLLKPILDNREQRENLKALLTNFEKQNCQKYKQSDQVISNDLLLPEKSPSCTDLNSRNFESCRPPTRPLSICSNNINQGSKGNSS